jgi:hypothetical protein
MAKTVQSVKNSLKFKVQPKAGLLTVRVGVKKYVLPVSARMLCEGGYMFLSFSATSELFEIKDKKLVAMDSKSDAGNAATSLVATKRRGRKQSKRLDMPTELETALKAIPAGYKLTFDLATGKPRLAKMRKKRVTKKK